jgi:Flp pilus assembly protein TadG
MRRLLRKPRKDGQALIELALVTPLILGVTFTCFQFVLLFLAYMSVMNSARDLSRWVAIHPNTIDSTATSALLTRLPPNLNSSKMTIAISPTCTTLVGGLCTSRPQGTSIAFTMTYNASSLIFLPTTVGCCGFTMTIPTTLPTYTVNMVAEPTN